MHAVRNRNLVFFICLLIVNAVPSERMFRDNIYSTNGRTTNDGSGTASTGGGLNRGGSDNGGKNESEIADAFKRYMIVPQCIPNAPKEKLSAIFDTIEMNFGNFIHPFNTINANYIYYPASTNAMYGFFIFDPDQPFLYQPFGGQLLEAMIINIPGNDVQKGDRIAPYTPHIPYPGTATHRCVTLVYKQPGPIKVTVDFRIRYSTNLTNFNMYDFAQKYKLGDPVAGNFYVSELPLCDPCENQNKSGCAINTL